jgi:hypothetical protein
MIELLGRRPGLRRLCKRVRRRRSRRGRQDLPGLVLHAGDWMRSVFLGQHQRSLVGA